MRPFRRQDALDLYDAGPVEGTTVSRESFCEMVGQWDDRGQAVTAELDTGEILGCGGLAPKQAGWTGSAVAWLIAGPAAMRYRHAAMRAILTTLPEMIRQSGCWRVETVCALDIAARFRALEALGFAVEAAMPGWAPDGRAGVLYAWIDWDRLAERCGRPASELKRQLGMEA